MDEGPEPQEWVERAAEEHHHHAPAHEPEGRRAAMMASAITAAVLAVLAAIGSLFSGHAANQAILAQTKATDQWAYYQAKSTKGHLYEVSGEIVRSLADVQPNASAERIKPSLDHFHAEAARYRKEMEEIRGKAEGLEEESRHEFHKHHRYALGIAAFQVGIVLASVSILVSSRPLYFLSLIAGVVGIVFSLIGLAA